jgi:hypothetical protein
MIPETRIILLPDLIVYTGQDANISFLTGRSIDPDYVIINQFSTDIVTLI